MAPLIKWFFIFIFFLPFSRSEAIAFLTHTSYSRETNPKVISCFEPLGICDDSININQWRLTVEAIKRDSLIVNLDSLSSLIMQSDSLFCKNWNTAYAFIPENSPMGQDDSVELILRQGAEDFFFNYWGVYYWGYGPRWGRMHRGLDLGLEIGDSVYSTFNGIVRYAEFNTGGYGNCIVIRHFNGIETLYAHLSKISCQVGDLVYSGDLIGLGGSTGRSDGPHLHFETRFGGNSFNPELLIDKANGTLRSDVIFLRKMDITDPVITHSSNSSSGSKYYTIKAGDTLSSIARKNGTTVRKLQQLNRISNPDKIRIGQKIRIR